MGNDAVTDAVTDSVNDAVKSAVNDAVKSAVNDAVNNAIDHNSIEHNHQQQQQAPLFQSVYESMNEKPTEIMKQEPAVLQCPPLQEQEPQQRQQQEQNQQRKEEQQQALEPTEEGNHNGTEDANAASHSGDEKCEAMN